MYQIRNLINRTVVPSDPQKNMKACEDFMLLLLHAHVVEAARVLRMKSPASSVSDVARSIIDTFLLLPKTSTTTSVECDDGVHMYAMDFLSLALLWHGFHDSIKEGDGDRILRYWKFLLVAFKSTNHRNYANEALNLLIQYHCTFSERQKAQLLWSRCINTRGYPGGNITCDLHMEHLNRRLKTVIRNMRANVKPARIVKAGKSLASVHHVCQEFEEQTTRQRHSDHHSYPSFGKNFDTVLKALRDENVFVAVSGRQHHTFKKYKTGLLDTYTMGDIIKKLEKSSKLQY